MKLRNVVLKCAAVSVLFLNGISPSFAYSGEVYVVCKLNPSGDNYLSLRECGSSKCKEITRLHPGTFVETWNPERTSWRQVSVMRSIQDEHPVDTHSGYVYSKYICEINMR